MFSPLEDLKKMRVGDVIDITDVDHFRLRPIGILEVVRFACTPGISLSRGTIDAATQVWGEGVSRSVPIERFRDEFSKVVTSSRAAFGLRMWRDMGVLATMVPELQAMSQFGSDGHKDIWEHTMDVLENGRTIPGDVSAEIERLSGILCEPEEHLRIRVQLRLCLSLLLHDIGKMEAFSIGKMRCPSCRRMVVLSSKSELSCDICGAISAVDRSIVSSRRIFFAGHEEASGRIALEMLSRLRFSHWMAERVSRDCVLHRLNAGRQDALISHPNELSGDGVRPSKGTPIEALIARLADVRPGMEADPWINLDEMLRWHIIAADSSTRAAEHRLVIDKIRKIAARTRSERRAETDAIVMNRPLLDGTELQSMFGLKPGPWIGEVHRRLRIDRMADPNGHDRERALAIASSVVEEMRGDG